MILDILIIVVKVAIIVVSLFLWLNMVFDIIGWFVSIPKDKLILAIKRTLFVITIIFIFFFFASKGSDLLNIETHSFKENLALLEAENK